MNPIIKKQIYYIASLALIFTLLLFNSSYTYAQTNIGFRGGLSYSGMTYRSVASLPKVKAHGVKNQPTFAFVFEHFYKDHAGIEVSFQKVTTGFIEYNEDETATNETHFDYFKVPVLANFYFGRSGRFHIKMGPHFGRLLKATDVKREFEAPNENIPILPTYGQEGDDPKKLMYGLTAGAGISKVFGISTIAADVRASYEFGRPENQDRIFDMTGTNIEFTLAYLFRVAKRK
uniref:outer membrane beta-barrel protein n=1 Tax=Echinicola shivajiensis TaxID=1035916 RepID=UPI001FEBBCDF|nr:outer membrane beta-barrel protein [Echinicola shivajiensis]